MTRHPSRLVALTAVLALLVLSGCSVPPDAREAPATREAQSPEPRQSPSSSFTIEDRTGDTLTFDDGAALPSDAIAGWNDARLAGNEWTLDAPDEGFGTWQYRSADDECLAVFWQGKVFDMTSTDDRAASDFVLASVMRSQNAPLDGEVSDGVMGFTFEDNPAAEYRYAGGADDRGSWVYAVRGFATLRAAVYLMVVCRSAEAPERAADVISRVAIHVSK